MNDRILKFADSKQYLGKIARSGENNTRSLAFDCSSALAEYPTSQIIAVIQRPQGDPYTVTPDTDGTIRRITLTSYDLEFNGHLQIELRVIDGEKILKSAIYTATVDDSIRGEADAPGQPVRDVLDRLDVEIKQAQAVVDDIRQKLENGEFNGSDAEVTAENIQSALGYAPVTPSDLAAKQNVLTDADKQSITKIGMTTGAAWTSAEQAQVRANIGAAEAFEVGDGLQMTGDVLSVKQGKYELIETFTLNEAGTVVRTKEPDGRNYNFIGCIILIHIGEVGDNRSVSIYMQNSKTGANIVRLSMGAPSKNYYGFVKADKVNNVWNYCARMLIDSEMSPANHFTTYTTLLNEGSESVIDKIQIFGLPVGTTITIKGVRADA